LIKKAERLRQKRSLVPVTGSTRSCLGSPGAADGGEVRAENHVSSGLLAKRVEDHSLLGSLMAGSRWLPVVPSAMPTRAKRESEMARRRARDGRRVHCSRGVYILKAAMVSLLRDWRELAMSHWLHAHPACGNSCNLGVEWLELIIITTSKLNRAGVQLRVPPELLFFAH
jgi:hypothetical protein